MITQLLPSAAAVLGSSGYRDTLGLAERVGPVRRLAVLLVDGLGLHLLDRSAQLRAVVSHGRLDPLRCTLPSTTPTSLVSLGTGTLPGEHGIVGFTVNVPGTERLLTHIAWRDDPDPAVWQPVPTVFAASGLPCAVVLPAAFERSGLTRAAYGGAEYVALQPGDDLAAVMTGTLTATAGIVYGYTPVVDTAAHVHGIDSPQWQQACAATAELIERLVAGLPADAALLVTADHGGLDVPAQHRFDLGSDRRLGDGVRVVAGEPRLRYLHTRAGAAPDVAAAWRAVLGQHADVLLRDAAIESGMFGPVAAAHRARIGDVVAVCTGDAAVLATGHEPPEVAALVGMHGAATPAEVDIPLLTFTAAR